MRIRNIVAFIMGAAVLTCAFTSFLSAATAGKAAVKGYSVSLSGSIDLNYYLDIPAGYDSRNTLARFTFGDSTTLVSLIPTDRNGSNYIARCSLPPVCLTDEVSLTLTDAGNNTLITDCCKVTDYIDHLALQYRDPVKNHDKYLQRLLEAMLIYGGNAQQHYGYRTDDPANAAGYMKNIMSGSGNQKISDVLDTFRNEASDIVDDIMLDLRGSSIKKIEEDNSGLSYKGASVLFNNNTSLRLYFTVTDKVKADSLTASYGGKNIPFTPKDGDLYLEFPGLYPDMFDRNVMEIAIGDKTYKYMPLDYIARCTADDNELAGLSCGMFVYALFTDLYVNNYEDIRPDNGIPVMYLNINESEGTIDDMIASPDHDTYCYGTVSIEVPEGFHYSDLPDNVCQSVSGLSMSIRGRGNSTWAKSNKKPFKIKLDKKADLFGLGANKHWVLVANALDPTLIKDRITAWLGDRMGFEFTPRGVPVDLVMSGEEYGTRYLGSYYLSENVRVDKNRVDISELSESDTDPQTITGGYLVQNGVQLRAGSPDRFFTPRGANWATHTPSFDTEADGNFALGRDLLGSNYLYDDTFGDPELGDAYVNPAQQQYIQDHICHVEDVMYEGGTAYRDLMDVGSSARYWLVNAVSLNQDAYSTGSTYIYKDRDQGNTAGKLYWGPLWDFDYAWTYNRITYGFPVDYVWIKPLICDRSEGGFIEEVNRQWAEMRPALNELIADGGVIDQYYEETRRSAEKDREMYTYADSVGDYYDDINDLKEWIRNRIEWIDENLADLGNYVHRAEFMVDGHLYYADYLTRQDRTGPDEISHPSKEGLTFVGWQDEDGNFLEDMTYITEDTTYTAVYLPDSEVTHAEDIIFESDHVTVRYLPMINHYQIDYTVTPEDAIDKSVEWSSSDPDYATVDDHGLIEYHGPGEVTITASLKNGVTKDFVLTVASASDPSVLSPDSSCS